jgi:hypothetical protein
VSEPIPDATPVDVPAADGGRLPYHAIAVATGGEHACALLDDHRVKCWGNNSEGQLGYGDTNWRGRSPSEMGDALPTVDLGSGRTATAIAATQFTSCAILDDGSIKCWGATSQCGRIEANDTGDQPGEMGDHLPTLDFGGRRAVNLAMGSDYDCAAMDDDTIWCWCTAYGPSAYGPGNDGGSEGTPWQLTGLPAKRVKALGPSGTSVAAVYDDGTISPQLPYGSVPVFASDRKVLALSGSLQFGTCALFDDATTMCVDGGSQLHGPSNAIALGVEAVALGIEDVGGGLCAVLSDGSIRCQVPPPCEQPTYFRCSSDGSFDLGVPAVAVTSNGSSFACALLMDGNIKCWSQVAATDPPGPWLGAAIDFTETSTGISYGVWHAVDLGTHP